MREAVVSSIEARADHPNPAGNTTFINVCPPHCTPWFADPRVLGVLERCFGPVPHTRIGGTSCVIHEPNPSPAERAAGFLAKPFRYDDLVNVLAEALP